MKGDRYRKRGWFGESHRHYLAAKGVRTGRKRDRMTSGIFGSAMGMGANVVEDDEEQEQDMTLNFIPDPEEQEMEGRMEGQMMAEEEPMEEESQGFFFAEKGEKIEWNGRPAKLIEDFGDGFMKIETNFGETMVVPEDQVEMLEEEEQFMASKVLPNPPKQTINTVQGEAEYVKTELEDGEGNWNNNYSTKDGFFLLHRGDKHHVYKVKGNPRIPAGVTGDVL